MPSRLRIQMLFDEVLQHVLQHNMQRVHVARQVNCRPHDRRVTFINTSGGALFMLIVLKDRMDAGAVPFYLDSFVVGSVVTQLVEGEQTRVRINSLSVEDSEITSGTATVTLYCSKA